MSFVWVFFGLWKFMEHFRNLIIMLKNLREILSLMKSFLNVRSQGTLQRGLCHGFSSAPEDSRALAEEC